VDQYVAAYQDPGQQLTQSALDLSCIGQVITPLNDMCQFILDNLEDCELAVGRANRTAQRYSDTDYKDLYDFCRLLQERTDLAELKDKAQAVMDAIVPIGTERFVRAEEHWGYRVQESHGVSIYFPAHEMSPFYRRLDFASETLWDDMLHRLLGT
jgi:hypothetical protein